MNAVYLNDAALSASLLSSDLAQMLLPDPKKIVDIATGAPSSAKGKRAQLTSNPPKLNPVNPTSGIATDPSADTFLGILAAFMASTILLQILASKNESILNTAQNNSSMSYIALAKVQVKKANDQLTTYQSDYEAAQHKSLLAQIFGGIAAGLCCLLSGLTGGLTAFIAAGIITGVMMSPAMQKLSDAMTQAGLPDWAQGLIKVFIVVVAAVLLCGISGGVAALTQGSSQGAKEAGEEAAVNAADSSESFFSKVNQNGFTKAQFLASSGQLLVALNPLGDLITASLKAAHVNDDEAKLIGQITGLVLSIAFTFGLGYLAAKGANAEEFCKTLRNTLGPDKFSKLTSTANFFRATTNITGGGFNVAAGVNYLQQADTLKAMSETKKDQIIYQALTTLMTQATQAELKQFSSQMDVTTRLSSQFNAFVDPGREAAEILG
ncbi:MAG: hypothetical protein V4487_02670 [Chlamydiota bacterium]